MKFQSVEPLLNSLSLDSSLAFSFSSAVVGAFYSSFVAWNKVS